MAANRIFWEMNVSYDSIHNFRVHPYMLAFFNSPDRVRDFCSRLSALGIRMPFEE